MPANSAAFCVADFWLSLNMAGIVITADLITSSCKYDFSFFKTSEDNSSELKSSSHIDE